MFISSLKQKTVKTSPVSNLVFALGTKISASFFNNPAKESLGKSTSGRNPDLLIGQHVKSSFKLKQAEIEILSCGYILVETENLTSAIYMSESLPIPKSKSDIAAATALAGEQLGLNFIYMDTGSGAQQTINQKMIGTVKKNITVPLFVGGGINNQEQLESTWKSGADMAVVGTCIENDFNKMFEFKKLNYSN